MSDVKLPMFGNVPKPVAFGGAGLVVFGGIYYYRKQKTNQANAAAVTQAGSQQIDPATGYPYGSAEDAAAMASQSSYTAPTDLTSGYGFQGYAGGSGGVFGTGTPGSFTSNAEWAQYVEAYMVNNTGADAVTVGNAVGKYITGQALTTDMVGLVQSAIAIGGYPPVSGPNGYPPSYQTATTGTTTPPPTGGGTTTTPPPTGGGTTTVANKTYTAPGNLTLSQIASKLGVDVPDIVSKTSATDYNHGAAWPYFGNWNKVVAKGIIFVY